MTMRMFVIAFLCAASVTGCARNQPPRIAPCSAGALTPIREDAEAGVGGGFAGCSAVRYRTIIVAPFTVSPGATGSDSERRLATDMIGVLHVNLMRGLRAAGIFDRVIDATAAAAGRGTEQTVRLEGSITSLDEGNQAVRALVGFGAGNARVAIESRLVDDRSRRIELVSADRRDGGRSPIFFAGASVDFVTDEVCEMTDAYVAMLVYRSGRDGGGGAVARCAAPAAWPVAAGSQVRLLRATRAAESGIVVASTRDSLRIMPAGGRRDTLSVGVGDIAQLELATTSRAGRGSNARLGAAIGGAVGAVIGGSIGSKRRPNECFLCVSPTVEDGFTGLVIGALAGAALGAIESRPVSEWIPVIVPTVP